MIRTNAGRIIAVMADILALGNRYTMRQHPSYAMCSVKLEPAFNATTNMSISLAIATSLPKPAAIAFGDFLPKLFRRNDKINQVGTSILGVDQRGDRYCGAPRIHSWSHFTSAFSGLR